MSSRMTQVASCGDRQPSCPPCACMAVVWEWQGGRHTASRISKDLRHEASKPGEAWVPRGPDRRCYSVRCTNAGLIESFTTSDYECYTTAVSGPNCARPPPRHPRNIAHQHAVSVNPRELPSPCDSLDNKEPTCILSQHHACLAFVHTNCLGQLRFWACELQQWSNTFLDMSTNWVDAATL